MYEIDYTNDPGFLEDDPACMADGKPFSFDLNDPEIELTPEEKSVIVLEEVTGAELTEAPSPQVKDIIDLVKELPTTDIKAFLDELATVFDQKADEEVSDYLPFMAIYGQSDIYRSVSKHIHNAFSVWFEGALDEL